MISVRYVLLVISKIQLLPNVNKVLMEFLTVVNMLEVQFVLNALEISTCLSTDVLLLLLQYQTVVDINQTQFVTVVALDFI
jgi:hypothetical protein